MIGMLPAVLIGKSVAAAVVLVGVCVASAACEAHSKPTMPSGSPVAVSSTSSATSAPGSASASDTSAPPSPSAGLASQGLSPTAAVPSALASEYPSEMAQIPAAIQTVRNFFDGVNHEIDTGDEAAAIATFTPKCQLCGDQVYTIKQLLGGGHKIRGGYFHLLRIESAAPSYRQVVTVVAIEDRDAVQVVDADGNVLKQADAVPPTKLIFDVELDVDPPKIWMLTRVGYAS